MTWQQEAQERINNQLKAARRAGIDSYLQGDTSPPVYYNAGPLRKAWQEGYDAGPGLVETAQRIGETF